MIQYNNFLMKREQSRAGSRFAKREKSRLLAKTILTLVALLAVTTGAWAQTVTVTWTLTDLEANPDVTTFTKDGVTLKCGDRMSSGKSFVNPVTFSNTLGNFTKIEITGSDSAPIIADEFTNNDKVSTWTGNAASISTPASITYATQFVFTIAPSGPEVAWDNAEKTGTFTMPGGNVTLNVEYYEPTGLAWKQGETDVPEAGVTVYEGFPFTLPTLDNPNSLTGITYESSSTAIATIDADGKVTIADNATGETTITAKYPGNDTYEDKELSYKLTVTAPITLTLASSDPEKGTVTVLGGASGVSEMIILSGKGAENPVQGEYFQVTGQGSNNSRYIGSADNHSLTISSLNGEMIDYIVLELNGYSLWTGYTVTSTAGEVEDNVNSNYEVKVTNINAPSVTISRSGQGNADGRIMISKVYVNKMKPISASLEDSDFPTNGNVASQLGVTLTAGSIDSSTPQISGGGTFTTDLGNFTRIEAMTSGDLSGLTGEGWTDGTFSKIWTGSSSSVSFEGGIVGSGSESIFFIFTIDPNTEAAPSNIKDLGDGKYSVLPGSEITLKATASEGYHVTGWKVGETDVTEGVDYSDYLDAEGNLMPATSTVKLTIEKGATITAVFGENEYNVALAEGTEDAANWKAKSTNAAEVNLGTQPLSGVKKDAAVTATYSGTRKVLGMTVAKKAANVHSITIAVDPSTTGSKATAPAMTIEFKTGETWADVAARYDWLDTYMTYTVFYKDNILNGNVHDANGGVTPDKTIDPNGSYHWGL